MGPVVIFLAIWTFVCVLYFAANIAYDLIGKKGKKSETEVIRLGGKDGKKKVKGKSTESAGGDEAQSADSPVVVTEYDDGGYGIKEPGKDEEYVETNGIKTPDSTTGHPVGNAADTEKFSQQQTHDEGPLLDMAKNAKSKTTVVDTKYQSDTSEEDELAEITRLQEENLQNINDEPDF